MHLQGDMVKVSENAGWLPLAGRAVWFKKALITILIPVMIFAMLYWCPHFDQISIRIIKTYDFLPPAVRHEFIDVFHFRIIAL